MNNHELNRLAKAIVTAELLQRGAGYVTLCKTGESHLHATNSESNRMIKLRIKAKRKGNWHATIDDAKQADADFWIFADLSESNAPRYWIVPVPWIRDDIRKSHQKYLGRHDGHRAENDESNHHAIAEVRLKHWQNKWEILNISPNQAAKAKS